MYIYIYTYIGKKTHVQTKHILGIRLFGSRPQLKMILSLGCCMSVRLQIDENSTSDNATSDAEAGG